jgi:hypothetical protein
MTGWIAETEALELIARRLGCDLRNAAVAYCETAWDGEIEVRELVFGPPYGIDRRPIPRARWGSAVVADAEETEEGRRYGHFWMAHPAVREFGPIHWQGPAAIGESGMNREVLQADIDRVWPPQAAAISDAPKKVGRVEKRRQQIIDAALQLAADGVRLETKTSKQVGDAIRKKLGVAADAKGHNDLTIMRILNL